MKRSLTESNPRILDTNGLGYCGRRHGRRAYPATGRRDRLAGNCVSRIPVGIRQSRQRARYERWLKEALATCRVLPVPVDESTARVYADIRDELKRADRPIPGNDLWIAALARQHSLPLLSRDQHFDLVKGLTRIGW